MSDTNNKSRHTFSLHYKTFADWDISVCTPFVSHQSNTYERFLVVSCTQKTLEALFNLMTWIKKNARTQLIEHHCILFTLIILENFTKPSSRKLNCLCDCVYKFLQMNPKSAPSLCIMGMHSDIIKFFKASERHESEQRPMSKTPESANDIIFLQPVVT